jgi:hypothetical protein
MSNRSGNNNRLVPYFISHSGKDKVIVDIILEIFDHHKRRPYRIINRNDLSRSEKPHWEQIKDSIQKSDAVLLILTRGITQQEHTQNWVAFEVGVAAGCDPPKRVIAIKGEDVEIPIPYVEHYYSYSSTFPAPQWEESGRDTWENQFKMTIYPMLSNVNYKPKSLENHCPHCKLRYYHHGPKRPDRPFKCPCCSNQTFRIGRRSSSNRGDNTVNKTSKDN